MYKIMGQYRGSTEVLDTAETLHNAEYLRGEYQLAFGHNWSIFITKKGIRV